MTETENASQLDNETQYEAAHKDIRRTSQDLEKKLEEQKQFGLQAQGNIFYPEGEKPPQIPTSEFEKYFRYPYTHKKDITKRVEENLKTVDPFKNMMKAINRLESRVEELSQKIEDISTRINIREISEHQEEIVIYFEDLSQRNEAYEKLLNKNIDFQPIGGAILTSKKAEYELKENNIKFSVAKDVDELYNQNPNFLNKLSEEVKKQYNLPSWKKQTNH